MLPYHCILCQQPTGKLDLCNACAEMLCNIKTPCKLCARPIIGEADSPFCGQCLKKSVHFDQLTCLGYYDDHLARLITQLKFQQQLNISKILSELLICQLGAIEKPGLIIPVPLHAKRLKQRGFNQALEMAKPLAKKLRVSIDTKSCLRIRHTQPQTLVEAKKRGQNVKNAFSCHFEKTPHHVAIIDDVVTTGHTVNELSRCLKKAGVSRIDVWCIAKTLSKTDRKKNS